MKKISVLLILILLALSFGVYYAFPGIISEILMDSMVKNASLNKKIVKIDSDYIFYLEGGRGPDVLMLHGYTASKENWIYFAGYLTDKFHVIIPDIPGFGESTKDLKKTYGLKDQMYRLEKFLEILKINKFHVIGNSMGGLYSIKFAAGYPEKVLSLALFDSGGISSPIKTEFIKSGEKGKNQMLLADKNDWDRLMNLIFYKPPFFLYPAEHEMIKTQLANREIYEKEAKEIIPEIFSLEPDLPRITVPTLILWGENDKVFDVSTAELFAGKIKNSRVIIIKECGHVPMLEKPKESAGYYINFLTKK